MDCSPDQEDPLDLSGGALNSCPPAGVSDGVTLAHLLRMKDSMATQCFEMAVNLNMGRNKKFCDAQDAEAHLSKYEEEIEEARVSHFNKTLALKRMQIWNALSEKLTQSDSDDSSEGSLKALAGQNVILCEKTRKVLQESRELQDQITELQKERLELKGLIKKRMQEMSELKRMKENQGELHKQAVERAEEVLEKHQKLAAISQNVLRGLILASKVNWIDDPKLKDIAMGLENLPN
ncbi:centromere protein H [Chanos chanos]|uniref:Centromere protein H n=1 Tax=Chanos chanos TaxID=29144 RepID=A0A6J2UNQ7_CHACN|nr:centromere protein H [Chanos chanos]